MFDLAHYRQYRAWIFDLDGTLSNTLQAHDLAWQHALDHFAIPYTAERMQQLGGVPIPDTVEILAREKVAVCQAPPPERALQQFDTLLVLIFCESHPPEN